MHFSHINFPTFFFLCPLSTIPQGTIPDYLYFDCPRGDFLEDFISNQHGWIWIVWLLSQVQQLL